MKDMKGTKEHEDVQLPQRRLRRPQGFKMGVTIANPGELQPLAVPVPVRRTELPMSLGPSCPSFPSCSSCSRFEETRLGVGSVQGPRLTLQQPREQRRPALIQP